MPNVKIGKNNYDGIEKLNIPLADGSGHVEFSCVPKGTNTEDATATANDILKGKTAYISEGKVEGTIETFDGSYECSGESTGGGITPTGTIEITENGTHDVTNYASAEVNIEDNAKYATGLVFNNLNHFGKPYVYLDLRNVQNLNGSFISNTESNTTVKHLTVRTYNKLTYANSTFYAQSKCMDDCLRHITLYIDTSEVPTTGSMFSNLTALEIIDGEPLNLAKATNIGGMFGACVSLKEIRFLENNISASISFADSPLLSDDSIQSIINSLATVETSQTLTLHADVKAKLTEAQLTQITSKNWTLA